MNYRDHFNLADDLIDNLNDVVQNESDPFMSSRYVGFVSIAAVAVFELAIKDIFVNFAFQKNQVFGTYTRSNFDRINGRIQYRTIKNEYISSFGEKYAKRFKKKVDALESAMLTTRRLSVKGAYNNLITWRNSFAHEGYVPNTVNYREVVDSYNLGKEILKCLDETMVR